MMTATARMAAQMMGSLGAGRLTHPSPAYTTKGYDNLQRHGLHKGSQLPLLRTQRPTIAQRCHGGARQTEELRASGSTAHKRALCGCERALEGSDVCDVLCDLLAAAVVWLRARSQCRPDVMMS